jgi:hypothetical protein
MHEHSLEGTWVDAQSGAQMEIEQHDDSVSARYTGGRGHENLRGTFRAYREGHEFKGEFQNHENNVEGHGKLRIEFIGSDEIRFSYEGDWEGGGTGGHAQGVSILHRRGA